MRQVQFPDTSEHSFPYDFQDIDNISSPLGIPWETSKDIPFGDTVPFIGFSWSLTEKKVFLPPLKKEKYLCAIAEWRVHPVHTLNNTRKLYGKLLYTCLIVPSGRAYLTNFEKMMGTFHGHPFLPQHPPRHLNEDLLWWENVLLSPSLSRDIPGSRPILDVRGFSDASSTTGIGIMLNDRWRAWRLLPNWKSGGRDIGWAEALGMELLTQAILENTPHPCIQVFCDNTGVIEGWWSGHSHNPETN